LGIEITNIAVLHVSPRPLLCPYDLLGTLDEVLDEHFGRYSYDEGGVIGAVGDVIVCMNYFLYPRN
jgi:hypothetical protein